MLMGAEGDGAVAADSASPDEGAISAPSATEGGIEVDGSGETTAPPTVEEGAEPTSPAEGDAPPASSAENDAGDDIVWIDPGDPAPESAEPIEAPEAKGGSGGFSFAGPTKDSNGNIDDYEAWTDIQRDEGGSKKNLFNIDKIEVGGSIPFVTLKSSAWEADGGHLSNKGPNVSISPTIAGGSVTIYPSIDATDAADDDFYFLRPVLTVSLFSLLFFPLNPKSSLPNSPALRPRGSAGNHARISPSANGAPARRQPATWRSQPCAAGP